MGLVVSYLTFSVSHGAGYFSLSFMPGNRRVLISHRSSIEQGQMNKGFGRRMLDLREQLAREAGANLLLATVKNENAIEIYLLESNGWKRFTNRKETQVSLWGKEL